MALHLRIIWIISMRGIPTFCQEANEKNDTESKKYQNSTKNSNSTNIIVIHICNLLIFTSCTNNIVIHKCNFLIFTWRWSKHDEIVLLLHWSSDNKNKFCYVALHLGIIWIICLRGIPTFWQEANEKNDTECKNCQNSTKCS